METDKNTRVNYKHYIGNALNPLSGTKLAFSLAAGLILSAVGTGISKEETVLRSPDATGTEHQNNVYEAYKRGIQELTVLDEKIDVQSALNQLGGDNTEHSGIEELRTSFTEKAHLVLADLHVSGNHQDGADISEQQYDELLSMFPGNIEDYGYEYETGRSWRTILRTDKDDVYPSGFLDECRIAETKSELTDFDRITAAQSINQCMNESVENAEGTSEKFSFVFMLIFAGFYFAMHGQAKEWGAEASRIPKNKRPKKHYKH